MTALVPYEAPRPNRRGVLFYGSAFIVASVLATQSKADPIHHAIDEFEAAALAYMNTAGDKEDGDPVFDIREEKLQALGQITPTTPEGAHRLMEILIQEEGGVSFSAESPLVAAMVNIINSSLGSSFAI